MDRNIQAQPRTGGPMIIEKHVACTIPLYTDVELFCLSCMA